MSKNYQIVYDKNYIQEGYIIYRDDFKKFMKIMNSYGSDFIIFANDEFEDDRKKGNYRKISIDIDSSSPLYEILESFYYELNNFHLYAKGDLDLGKTHLRIQKEKDMYELSVMKDISYKKNGDYNCAIFQVQDTPIGSLQRLYAKLADHASIKEEDSEKVKEKMINLIPNKKQ